MGLFTPNTITMKILALDLGTKTGWAFGGAKDTDQVYSGTQDFSLKRGESPGMRLLSFDKWIYEMLAKHKPKMVGYEMPHQRGGHSTQLLLSMLGILHVACEKAGIEYASVHSATLKKSATGSGKASKEDMVIVATEKFNRKVIDDNEADALHILAWARDTFEKEK